MRTLTRTGSTNTVAAAEMVAASAGEFPTTGFDQPIERTTLFNAARESRRILSFEEMRDDP
jgi:hypothetical protein